MARSRGKAYSKFARCARNTPCSGSTVILLVCFDRLCGRNVRKSVVGVMFEGCSKVRGVPARGPCRELSLHFQAYKISIDEICLCKKMRTVIVVIAVIVHPSRALFDSVRQSYDRFSINAAQNPQNETAFLARSSTKRRVSPFYHAHRDQHTRPYPVCKA